MSRETSTRQKFIPIIGAANQKGGVGKTTNVRIIGEYLAKYCGKRVLFCDLDSQYSLSARYLGIHKNPVTDFKEPPTHPDYDPRNPAYDQWDGKSSIGNIFLDEPVLPYKTRIGNIEIAPADEYKLRQAEEMKRQDIPEKVYDRLHKFLTLEEVQKSYDVILIDTPPAKGALTIAAFKAITHLVIPLELEIQAIEGLQGILTLWKQEVLQRPSNYPLKLLGILPNKVHSRRLHDKKLLEYLESKVMDFIMPIKLYDRTQYPEVDSKNVSIFDLPNRDEAKIECLKLGKYIAERVF